MRKKLLALSSLLLFIGILVSVYDNGLQGDVTGAPAGCTGSPADGHSCTSCHTGTAIPITGWITSDIPAEGYVPGETYTITGTAAQANCVRFGFEISPQEINGTEVGTLVVTNTTQTQITGTKYITHKEAGTTGSNSKSWSFNWTAPTTGGNSFVFYGAFNCANNDGTDQGDKIYLSTLAVNQCQYTPHISSSSGSFSSCNGSLQLTVPNASTYLWSDGTTTSQFMATTSGNYAVTVTDSIGCKASTSATVTVSNLTVTEIHSDIACGNTSGSISLTASEGITPYTYHWSNGATITDIQNLSAGDYNVTVSDAGGCTDTLSINIINQISPPVVTQNHVNATCGIANGSIDLLVTGGTPPYSFRWNNNETTQNLSLLDSGTYQVTVTDASGCTASAGTALSQGLALLVSERNTPPTCGSNNGSIIITATAGTPPYSYFWNTTSTTESLTNIGAGTYTVTVFDSAGCTVSQSDFLNNLNGPVAIAFSMNELCNNSNGMVNLTINGGTPPYTYKWNSGQTTQDIDSLTAGTYTVTITDSNLCVITDSAIVRNRPGPVANSMAINTSCGLNNGSIMLMVRGGTQPYSYNWNTGLSAQNINSLSPGEYSVTVNDANACTAVSSDSILRSRPAPKPQVDTVGNTAFVDNFNQYIHFQWFKDGEQEQEDTFALLIAGESGNYSVVVTDSNGCTAQSPPFEINTGINTVKDESSLTISPNPAIDILYIGGLNGENNICIYSIEGKMQMEAKEAASVEKAQINISFLPPGVYIIRIENENAVTATRKFVKM